MLIHHMFIDMSDPFSMSRVISGAYLVMQLHN